MNIKLNIFLPLILAIGLVILAFTIYQVFTERKRLMDNLEKQTTQLASEYVKDNELLIKHGNIEALQKNTVKLEKNYKLLAVTISYGKDSFLVVNTGEGEFLHHYEDSTAQLATVYNITDTFIKIQGQKVYQFITPFKLSKLKTIRLIFYIDAEYIVKAIRDIWLRNFLRWFLQAAVVTWITILLIRWLVLKPINKIINWVKAVRHGNLETLNERPPASFLKPLQKEINHMALAMHEARAIAEEEAKLRTTAESVWTPERLKEEIKKLLQNRTLIVVSNREPYMHVHSGREIRYIVPASGMVTAMEPILEACGGLWIASGTGDADKDTVNKQDKISVPPDSPKYTLRRVWLSKDDEKYFYYGFSNEGLWPLCHIAHTRPIFRNDDWRYYQKVNNLYAKVITEEVKNEEEPLILVQDYHFALLPKMIKKERPDAKVAIFWHIPWPNPESFGICPWQHEILRGMLGADLIGFHTQYHCNNFLETVSNSLESRILWESFSVKIARQVTKVKPFPISIAFTLRDFDQTEELRPDASELLKKYGIRAELMGIGVDRIDYTKGIIERFLAIERFFDKAPSYLGNFTFVQIGAPSRTEIKSYADIVNAVEDEAVRINNRLKTRDWRPILFLKGHHSHEEIMPFYKASDLCMVTSLHDGMNLVAKEYVAARNTVDGVLILSRFAGAAQELHDAIIVNPYDIEQTADSIRFALEMPKVEQHRRMKQMRQVLVNGNIYAWAGNLIRSLVTLNGKT